MTSLSLHRKSGANRRCELKMWISEPLPLNTSLYISANSTSVRFLTPSVVQEAIGGCRIEERKETSLEDMERERQSWNRSQISSVQSLSRVWLFATPGLPVHHQLPESTQTHVYWVCDIIQPSHPLLSPSPPAPNPSQHQGLFQWVNSLPRSLSSRQMIILLWESSLGR